MGRRSLLNAFLASVSVNAVLGIWALISTDFGQTQGKILTTSFCVSGAMLGVLVNGAPLSRRVRWPVPVVAASAAVAGFVLIIVMIWLEPDTSGWWKSLVTLLVIATAGTLVGLLALLALRAGHEPLRLIHNVLVGLLALTSIVAIWVEADASWIIRLIGVESVLVAALTLTVPALARFLPPDPPRGPDLVSTPTAAIVCGRCGAHLDQHGRELPAQPDAAVAGSTDSTAGQGRLWPAEPVD